MKPIIMGVILGVFVFGMGIGFSINVSAEEGLIPSWVKSTAGFWVDGQIGDSEFISALQFLIKEGVLVIPDENNSGDTISKYDGLTEEQILKVTIIEDNCASKTLEVEAEAGKTVAKIYAEKCEKTVIEKIEGYRNQNNP